MHEQDGLKRLCLASRLPRGTPPGLLGCGAFDGAGATSYPAKPVKLVIPYPPGGGTDITGRAMAQRLSEVLGQSVVIENKPGATGMIGAASVAKAPAGRLHGAVRRGERDGDQRQPVQEHDLRSAHRLRAGDPGRDLPAGVRRAGPSSQSLRELIEAARAKPDTVSYGSIGSGSPQHLAAELLSSMAKAKFLHIPYKGSGPLVQDAVGGHIDMAVSSVPPAVPLVRSGKLRALAVTSAARSEALPDVPTMAELGFAGYEFNTWVGVAVPKGTPKDDRRSAARRAWSARSPPAEVQSDVARPGRGARRVDGGAVPPVRARRGGQERPHRFAGRHPAGMTIPGGRAWSIMA